jgi:PAS domain S-box-containing protein
LHRLLERQLKRHFGGLDKVPPALRPFLAVIDGTYTEADSDRTLAERSLELASQELLQSNQTLRKQQHEQQVIFDTVPAIIIYKDAANRILRVNEMGAKALGHSVQELEGARTEDLFPPELAAALHADDLEVIRSGQPKLGIVERHPGPDGGRWMRTDKMPYRDDSGAIIGVILLSVDITENRRAEEAVRRSEERYRLLVETATEGMWSLDPKGATTFTNQVMADMLGIPREAMLGRNIMEFVAEEDQALARERLASIMAGTAVRLDFRFRRADGGILWTQASGAPIVQGGQVIGALGMLTDITQRKEAEQKLQEAYEALKKVDRDRTQFLNTAAHELNTPLTPIKLQIHMLRGRGDQEASKRTVDILDRNFDRLAHLVKDLLDAARIQARQLPLRMEAIDLGEVARQTLDSYRPLATAAGIGLEEEGLGPMPVLGDPGRLSQVLDNLLSNAVKFTPRGGRVRLEGGVEGGQARVAVSDSGRGLRPEDIGRLFKPFSQVHDPMEQTVPGTGLGLYISRSIVEAHGGTLQASSRGRDRGATFRLAIPLRHGFSIERATSKAA